MQIVLAVNEDKILGKPSEIPEGKMDVLVNEVCDVQHSAIAEPIDPNMPVEPGIDGNMNTGYTEENFGIY